MKTLFLTQNLATHFNKLSRLFTLFIIVFITSLFSCQPDDDDKPQPLLGTVKFNFNFIADEKPLVLDEMQYVNDAGNTFSITKLKFYVSNISLNGCECGDFKDTNGYYLMEVVDDPNKGGLFTRSVIEIPFQIGTYESLSFGVGVDEYRNANGPYTGDLDFINGMNWTWSGDYIFLKIEGQYLDTSGNSKNFIYHVGGNDAFRETELLFTNGLTVMEDQSVELSIRLDIQSVFNKPKQIDFNKFKSTTAPGEKANSIATNFINSIRLKE